MSHHNLFPHNTEDFNEEASAMFATTDVPFLQFAPSVPPQHVNRTRSMEAMAFNHNPFQSQDPLMTHPMLFNNFPPSTSSTSVDSIFTNTNTMTNNPRQSQSRADRRAEHNALERARRESLNSKFQKLALSLPNLSNDTRPSKNTIIERTLDFVQDAKLKEERMKNQIEELERVNRYLLSQLDNKNNTNTASASSTPPQSVVSRRSSFISISRSPHIPQISMMENKSPIKLETSSSVSPPPAATIITPHDNNKSDATAYHNHNQAFMQNLYHTKYDESEDDEDITELNQINPFAFQPFSIMPENLQYSLMDYSS